ncbi:hypothetical protein PVAP13_6KG201606 [Panicum virgatum]|uniref:Uncharacterized protein n=1 Tax=Panicum virgatum TaxID=38727 RepID=A0A8T0REZ5_PANVG|nr:hypothetical protein PVAP13_6KG201606 [Panicum virgatum]
MASIKGAAVSAILKILANKLAPSMLKQYSSIVGVTMDLQDLKGRFEDISSWLEKAGCKTTDNDQFFIRKLKHVAYDVDDIVDEFHLEAEKHEAEVANNIVSKCLCTKPKSYMFQFKAALKIKAIKNRFDAIVKQRTDFSAIVNSLPEGHPVPHMNRTAKATPTVPNVAVASIICGREREKQEIISKLVDKNNQQIIKIVSIIGLGGSGKTALSNLVFGDGNTVKDHFEVRIWVHVPQEFDVQQLMMKMFEAITYQKSEHHSIQNIIQTIADTLTGKRYLLVLDDVWTVDRSQWEDFMLYIKRGAPGSSILLTSRNRNVAEAVESTDLSKLSSLSKDDTWTVFTQIIGEDIKGLDSELLEVGREIVNKCGGVPLAIKVLANVLRGKTRIEQWKAVRDSNLLDAEDKEHRVLASLMLSYSHLPSHLKRCFTICSLFPKGLPLDKQQLVDQWIAHNDVGDECFNSLVQVSFLQDVKEYFGRFILDEQISTNVPKDATSSTKYHKYFSLNARAIYVDGGDCDDIIFNKAKNAKHLCSIIANNNLSTTMLTAIFQTKHLKYLEMSRLQCESLPETMSDIWSLQALHLECSSLLELPKSIGKLQKLRTLNLSWCMKLKFLPDSIGDCNMLSSIYLCQYMELAALPNSIDHTKIKELPVVITKLRNLQCLSLRIGNLDKLQVLNLEYCVQLKLHVLNLENCGELFAGISELANVGRNSEGLIIRGISHVLEKDDAHKACLKEKTNLQRLKLEWKMHQKGEVNTEFFFNEKVDTMLEEAVLDGLEPPAGIKELEICGYSGEKYAWWMHNQVVGTQVKGQACFQFLRAMKLSDFQGLKHLQGLVELPCLEELELHKMPSLESISCGPFPSLVKLLMDDLPRLEEVWLVAERTMSDGEEGGNCSNCAPHSRQVRVGNCLTCLNISNCLTLKIKTFLPLSCHLKHWKLSECAGKWTTESNYHCQFNFERSNSFFYHSHLQNTGREWEVTFLMDNALGELRYLQELNILNCCRLSSLPQAMGQLTSLQVLRIGTCDGLKQLPECLGELCSLRTLHVEWLPKIKSLPQSLQHQHITSLEDLRIHAYLCALCKLHISGLDGLACFPESMCRLTSPKELYIDSCPRITSFPQGMESLASLEKLCISRLGGIVSLPEGIKGFTALKKLEIIDCQGIKSLP